MDNYDTIRLGLISAVQAEIEGMKVTNLICLQTNSPPNYNEEHFQSKAEELRNISYCHNEQL